MAVLPGMPIRPIAVSLAEDQNDYAYVEVLQRRFKKPFTTGPLPEPV